MPGTGKSCRSPIAGRLVVLAAIVASALLLSAPLARAAEGPTIGVNVESGEGLFSAWHYEVPMQQIRENQDVSEVMTVKIGGSGPQQLPRTTGMSFARIAQLGGIEAGQILEMSLEESGLPGRVQATLTPAEILGFWDEYEGDSNPVMAMVVGTQEATSLYAYLPWNAEHEQARLTTGPGKEALIVSIKVSGRVLKLGPIKASPAEPEEGEAVTFSLPTVELEGHADPQAQYEWNFGDGKTSSADSPTHTFAEKGAYSVTVNVRDPSNGAHAAATPLIVDVTEEESGGPSPPPTECKGGGSPPCDEAEGMAKVGAGAGEGPPGKTSVGAPHGAAVGTTSGSHTHHSAHHKHGASALSPAPKSEPGQGHGDGEGNGEGSVAGVGTNGGAGGGTAGGNARGTEAPSAAGHADAPATSELAGNSSAGASPPHDGAIDRTDATSASAADEAGTASGRLVGYIIDPSSAGLPQEFGTQGGGAHPNASLFSPGGSPGAGSSDFLTWLLIGAGVLACIGLGTFSEMRPRRKGGRARISGASS